MKRGQGTASTVVVGLAASLVDIPAMAGTPATQVGWGACPEELRLCGKARYPATAQDWQALLNSENPAVAQSKARTVATAEVLPWTTACHRSSP
ncbi:hypothetical protein ACQEVC_24515 [Plantactinospora sp. CA-294935]|uniref:hypothetical protein n=1 Tax=Plantactinospora sp. CA-294935 TaxID=3240012 RepID=UPI003D8D6D43